MEFFTPGRTIGLLLLLAVMGVVIYLIKRLEAGAVSAAPEDAVEPSQVADAWQSTRQDHPLGPGGFEGDER